MSPGNDRDPLRRGGRLTPGLTLRRVGSSGSGSIRSLQGGTSGCQVVREPLGPQKGRRAEALEVVARTKPDLILMDLMMPGKDGLATLRELKKNEATRAVPVIIITANSTEYETCRKEAKIGGAEALLTKPFSPAKLVSEIQRFFPRGLEALPS